MLSMLIAERTSTSNEKNDVLVGCLDVQRPDDELILHPPSRRPRFVCFMIHSNELVAHAGMESIS